MWIELPFPPSGDNKKIVVIFLNALRRRLINPAHRKKLISLAQSVTHQSPSDNLGPMGGILSFVRFMGLILSLFFFHLFAKP